MDFAIYGIFFVALLIVLSLGGYMWYLTPGKNDRLE